MTGTSLIVPQGSDILTGDTNPFLIAAGPGGGGFGAYVKFVKEGRIIDRENEDVIKTGEVFIPHIMGMKHGYKCWVDGDLVDTYDALVIEEPKLPAIKSLTDHGPYTKYEDGTEDGWSEYVEIQFIIELENDEAEQYTLQCNSKSAINGARSLLRDYGNQYMKQIDDDGNVMFPVVEFDTNSFTLKNNKRAGTLYAPNFKIVDWVSVSEIAQFFDGIDGDGSDDESNYEDSGATQIEDQREEEKAQPARKKKARVQSAEPADGDDAVDENVSPPKRESTGTGKRPRRGARRV